MNEIQVLEKEVIDQIAAGEVVERPLSVVKELVENAIDAGATAITVEIRGGGISLIRVTDNGSGIEAPFVRTAFLPHATSKIRKVEDLLSVRSLGFRGEALSSVAAVSRVELITKTKDSLTGIRYRIEGGRELSLEEVGAPGGSTFLVRDLFFNIPARKKFLGSERTEGNAISSLMEHLSLSHPEISFCFLSGGKAVLDTAGNRKEKDVIYRIFGNRVANSLLPVEEREGPVRIFGYIGKPDISRGSRNVENYFVNGRYVKSKVLTSSIEDAYRSFLMQHQYPFTVLHFEVDGEEIDVNIHPQKMELKFHHAEAVYDAVVSALRNVLERRELIPEGEDPAETEKKASLLPEPFERSREEGRTFTEALPFPPEPEEKNAAASINEEENTAVSSEAEGGNTTASLKQGEENTTAFSGAEREKTEELSAPEEPAFDEPQAEKPLRFLSPEAKKDYRILGQVFFTYWIVEFSDKLYLVDQHAAHEKVIFERLMKQKNRKEQMVQMLYPGIVLELSPSEEEIFRLYSKELQAAGYRFEPFGGRAVEITGVPSDLYGLNVRDYFLEMLDELTLSAKKPESETLYLKIATMSCKAAVKGNQRLSEAEFSALLSDLLACDNPYQCPHGRPTIVTVTKYELERKFKRIVG